MTTLRRALGLAALAWSAGATASPAAAADATVEDAKPAAPAGQAEAAPRPETLLGDAFGLRTVLGRYGVSLGILEFSEVLGNPRGGAKQGAAYEGLTVATLQMDTEKAFGWHGGQFNASALQIHGRNLSGENLLTLQTASGIEADRATRLWELWYDQSFLEGDRLSVRVGQQSADQEFLVNPSGAYFINTMFGWPVVPSYDLPGGGPAYPLSAPAVRVKYRPVDGMTVLLGAFSGSPTPTDGGDPQRSNRSGTDFPVRGGLFFAEVQFGPAPAGGGPDSGPGSAPARTIRLGAWYDTRRFGDLRTGTDGLSLADPNSNGNPRQRRGNYALYAVADQVVWQDGAAPNRAVSMFGRLMGSPQANRNLVDIGFNGGVVYRMPFDSRPDDAAALGGGYAHVSSRAAALDRDATVFSPKSGADGYSGIRSSETFIEATYQYQVRPWWQLQPDLQYVFHPGGGIANPLRPTQRVKDELILGLRTTVTF